MTKKLYNDSLIANRTKLIEKMKQLNLFSDPMARKTFEDLGACEHVLRTLTGNNTLAIKENFTQFVISKYEAKDIIMDVLVEDADNKLYEIEIQKADAQINHAKRMLYYSSTIIGSHLPKGDKKYKNVPELYIFYLTEPDIWHLGRTCYSVRKHLDDFDVPYDDGLHMFYVNAEIDDGSAIANLMKYFKTANPYDLSQGNLSKRINYLKETKEGLSTMCEFTQRIHNEGKLEGKFEDIKNLMLSLNISIDKAMDVLKTPQKDRQYFKDMLAKEM